MSKFNRSVRTATRAPVVSEAQPSGLTFEGAPGWARTPESELFLLAVSHMGEDTFYESAPDRHARLVSLVQAADAKFLAGFVPWLRAEANMRTSALVCAAESRQRVLVNAACQRADEPGEMIAYWLSRHGRDIPACLRRGVADAVLRLYTERAWLKWDSRTASVRFADVIELVQPRYHGRVYGTWRDDLYRWIIEQRHNRDTEPAESLAVIRANRAADASQVTADQARDAGLTWENVLSAGGSWEQVTGSMGYMALLRNLRNFDHAGITDEQAAVICAKLADPAQVAASRQFPFRFLAAYKAAPSLRWGHALEQALQASLANVPALSGRTLVLVDRSGSMFNAMSDRSDLMRAEVAALFGACLALRAESADLVQFGTSSGKISFTRGEAVLRLAGKFGDLGGTNTASAVRAHYDGHDRVVIVTDEQAWGGWRGADPTACVPPAVPVYTWNLAGYKHGHGPSGQGGRFTFGGLTDQSFRMIPLLETGRDARWPWET